MNKKNGIGTEFNPRKAEWQCCVAHMSKLHNLTWFILSGWLHAQQADDDDHGSPLALPICAISVNGGWYMT
jgi:hypothetical protein